MEVILQLTSEIVIIMEEEEQQQLVEVKYFMDTITVEVRRKLLLIKYVDVCRNFLLIDAKEHCSVNSLCSKTIYII